MKTPCADLIRDRIKKMEEWLGKNQKAEGYMMCFIQKGGLEELLPQIESIESQSVENMMEEMPYIVCMGKFYGEGWCAFIEDGEIAKGNIPSEALQELKKKLNQ